MKKVLNTLALLLVLGLVIVAGRQFNEPTEAAVNHSSVTTYLNQGFSLDSVNIQPYYYLVPPTGNYTWGTVEVDLHGRTGGEFSLETTYATVKATVMAREKNGKVSYAVTTTEKQEVVVY